MNLNPDFYEERDEEDYDREENEKEEEIKIE